MTVATLEIISPGPLATLQDTGRPGRMKYGVPPGGALDREALEIANALVGNSPEDVGIEITIGGFSARALAPATVAFTGAWAPVDIDGAPVHPWTALHIEPGRTLNMGSAAWGTRIYLAIAGGIDAPSVLGSASTFIRGNMGGLAGDGRPLRSGDTLYARRQSPQAAISPHVHDWAASALMRRTALLAPATQRGAAVPLHVVLGPQHDLFTEEGIATFAGSEYTVTPLADRMGARLDGPVVAHSGKADIVSDGMPAGAVQIPGDGKPIIMLADRQTTGGYAKIACVASCDLDIAGQLRPGTRVRFVPISVEQAHDMLAAKKAAREVHSTCLRMKLEGVEHTVRVVEDK